MHEDHRRPHDAAHSGPTSTASGGIERVWHVLFVRVDTDAGIYGLGESGNFAGDRLLIQYCREWLIGKDPLAINPFVRAMLYGGLPPYDPQMSATATVTGAPIWAVSGDRDGAVRPRRQGPRARPSTTCSAAPSATGSACTSTAAAWPTRPTSTSWRALAQRVTDEGFKDFKFDAEWIAPGPERRPLEPPDAQRPGPRRPTSVSPPCAKLPGPTRRSPSTAT